LSGGCTSTCVSVCSLHQPFAGETPLDMCKKHFIQPKFGPQSLQKGDPKEVEKLLVEAGGHEKGSWGLMGERVKDTFGW